MSPRRGPDTTIWRMVNQRRSRMMTTPAPMPQSDGPPRAPFEPDTVTIHHSDAVIPADSPVVMASVEEVMEAINELDLDRPWTSIRHQVIPVLPRWRPFPAPTDDPITRSWPPGLETTFGLDIGPAFLYIGEWAVRQWQVSADQVADQAIGNIRAKVTAKRRHPVFADTVDGMPIRAFQSRDGWASALLLMPDLIARIFGPDPVLLLAPMRDLLIATPIESDPELATGLLEDFAAMDPNGLAVPLLALVDGRLSFVTPADGRARRTERHH